MAEKPILFNTEMVKAILDGRKTQTRRLVKVSHRGAAGFNVCFRKSTGEFTGVYDWDDEESMYEDRTPAPCQPGDVLWVRETWAEMPYGFVYRASGEPEGWDAEDRWRPSIHMPKEAARLFLRVKDVRIERLQDITAADVLAEGAKDPYDYQAPKWYEMHKDLLNYAERAAFAGLWETTVKQADLPRYGWDANPWVWVIEFERTEKP